MLAHAAGNPLTLVKKCLLNAAEFYFPAIHIPLIPNRYEPNSEWFQASKLAISLFVAALWSLALMGLGTLRKEGASLAPAVAVIGGIAVYAVPYLPFVVGEVGHSQYTLGSAPLLAILAGGYLRRLAWLGWATEAASEAS